MTIELSKLNFRDLGGLPVADGRRLRHHRLYRSEGPASFSTAHREELAALDIKLVCDLRSETERSAAPNDWSATARLFNIEITSDMRNAANAGWDRLRDDPSEAAARAAMLDNYRVIPGALLPYMRPLLGALIDGQTPALLHCTAGKDRTGVLVGILLALLGVSRAAILADYLRSDIFAKNQRLGQSIAHAFERLLGFTPAQATIDAMIGVDPEFLNASFDSIERQWGGIDGYFNAAGVSAPRRAAFREALLT
jgi:protein-tyrosine phosphatase